MPNYRSRMARENVAYGRVPTEEAYGRTSNIRKKNNTVFANTNNNQSQEEEDTKKSGIGPYANFDSKNFSIYRNGELYRRYPAQSGLDDCQGIEYVNKQNCGPIPEGDYVLKFNDFEKSDDVEFINDLKNIIKPDVHYWTSNPESWSNARNKITPMPNTETYGRGGFYLHGSNSLNSLGCIDLGPYMDDFVKIREEYKGPIPIQVKYPENWGKTDNANEQARLPVYPPSVQAVYPADEEDEENSLLRYIRGLF